MLRSRYLTLGVMGAVALAAMIALVYPQTSVVAVSGVTAWLKAHPVLAAVGSPLGATHVFVSWWFLAAAALLFVNGSLCLVEQIEKATRLTRKKGFALSARMAKPSRRNRITVSARDAQVLLDEVSHSLRRAGLDVRMGTHRGDPALLAVARGWAQWGSVVFHGGLLLTLASAVAVSLTFAKGQFQVVVGGGFADAAGAYGAYQRGALGPTSLGGWRLSLNRFDPRYRRGAFVPGPASTVLVETASGRRIDRLLTRGEYFDVEGTNIFQGGAWGFAPVLTVTDPAGRSRTGSVAVARARAGAPPVGDFDVARGIVCRVQMLQPANSTRSRPKLRVELLRGTKVVLSAPLSFEETRRGGGYSVTYDDFRYWSEFTAVRSPWLPGVNFAFWVLVAGASVMYFWPATYAWALVREEGDGNAVYLGGRREKYSRDFAGLAERAKQALESAEKESA